MKKIIMAVSMLFICFSMLLASPDGAYGICKEYQLNNEEKDFMYTGSLSPSKKYDEYFYDGYDLYHNDKFNQTWLLTNKEEIKTTKYIKFVGWALFTLISFQEAKERNSLFNNGCFMVGVFNTVYRFDSLFTHKRDR